MRYFLHVPISRTEEYEISHEKTDQAKACIKKT